MIEQTSLSRLLKRYRLAAGLSQEALAQRAELSARAISDLERGLHHAPHATTLDLLAAALSLSSSQRALLLAAARPELAVEPHEPEEGADARSLGLPTPPTALIGREHETAQALALLRRDTVRLITLTGPSGVGKTRLALQVAYDIASDFRDGAVFVDLSSVREVSLVPGALAQALHLRERANEPLDQQIRAHLRDKHMLILLDNFEQVVDSAILVADMLAWCPRVSFLVTSRAPLRLRGEQTLQIAPLSLEDAIVLFRERAHAVRQGSTLAVSEAAAICERLDCLPLAIELAAGQVAILSLPQILEQLDQHVALALAGARDLPARQRTMEAAIGWGYGLLTVEQQRCFRALGVFVGGASLMVAQAVCWDESTVSEADKLIALAALVDTSLVQAEITPGGYTRFHMLELVREYALQRLRAEGEEEACRRRHAAFYAAFIEAMTFYGVGTSATSAHLAHELSNARAALKWAEERRVADIGLRLSGFARLWMIHGMPGEAVHWLATMLALDAESRTAAAPTAPLLLRAERLYGYARVLLNVGNLAQAEAVAQESVLLAQEVNDQDALSNAYATLGMIAQATGNIEQATTAFTESVAHAGPDARSESRYHALFLLGELARYQGDFDRAHRLLESALEGAQAAENAWDCAIMITLLAHLERQQQDNAQARRRYLDSLERFHDFGSPGYFAWCLEGYSALLCAEGNYARASRLCAAAATLRLQARAPLPMAERAPFEQTLASAREALGEEAFAAEWDAGSSLTETAALAEAMKSG